MRKKQGFTLIELMIVVFIIGILAAVVIPASMGFREKSGYKLEDRNEQAKTAEVRKNAEEPAPPLFPALIPQTDSAALKVKLVVSDYIRKFKVYTLFDVDFSGFYVFSNPDATQNTFRLFFPFPKGTSQARDVSLKISGLTSETLKEPENVRYGLRGIECFATLAANEKLRAEVRYNTQGNERYIYEGPGAGRAGALKIEMILEGGTSELIPPEALQPQVIGPGHLLWDFNNLITERKIIVELPGAMTPTGRVILFLRLAGLAVFLFGIGFMYLNDLTQPGRLDNFRLGHFLLLALTYSLFFIIFTVLNLSENMDTVRALLLSTFLSLPLLMIHTGRFLGIRFSFTHVLPLALFTLGIVINGVYGGPYRSYIFIGFTVFAAAFVTLTYKTWTEKRKAAEEKKMQEYERQLRTEEEKKEAEKRKKAFEAWRMSVEKRIGKIMDKLIRPGREAEALEKRITALLDYPDREEHLRERQFVEKRLGQSAGLKMQEKSLCSRFEALKETQDEKEFSGLSPVLEEEAEGFCTEYEQALEILQKAIADLLRMRMHASDQEDNRLHCISCGSESGQSPYCPNCGIVSPVPLNCGQCGEIYRLPVHMIDREKAGNSFHCIRCGQKHDFRLPSPALFSHRKT